MLHSMYSAKGIGLAAPQVGIHKQLLVIDLDIDGEKQKVIPKLEFGRAIHDMSPRLNDKELKLNMFLSIL